MKAGSGIILALFIVFQAGAVWAATVTSFTVSATIPDPPGTVSIAVSSVNAASGTWTAEPSGATALSFDPMTFNTTDNIYLPDHFFAVDFGINTASFGSSPVPAASGSAGGSLDVSFSYSEGNNPNGSSNGLGYKSSITFAKEVSGSGGTVETLLTDHGPKKRLIDLNGENVTNADLSGGWLRVYIGVCTGGSGDPAGCQPFSNADAAGMYTGTLTATSTVD